MRLSLSTLWIRTAGYGRLLLCFLSLVTASARVATGGRCSATSCVEMADRSINEMDAGARSVRTESYTGSLDTKNGFMGYTYQQSPTTQSAVPIETMVTEWYRFFESLARFTLWNKPQKPSRRPAIKTESSSSTRTDSDISLYSLSQIKTNAFVQEKELYRSPDPIRLVLSFEDRTHTKSLDYKTFANWQRVEALLLDMEIDGIWVDYLWDVVEDMRVTGGDWDARVRPGWEVHASCTDCSDLCGYNDDWDAEGSSVDDDSDEDWREEVYFRQEWWFSRWRHRVESRRSRCASAVEEPSWRMVIAVCGLVVPFLLAMILFLA